MGSGYGMPASFLRKTGEEPPETRSASAGDSLYPKIERKSRAICSALSAGAMSAEITAPESAPASMTLNALARVMPPMATMGFPVSARPADSFKADNRAGILLAACREDRTDGDVVRTACVRRARLGIVMRRYADDAGWADNCTCILRRQVFLANVHAVEAGQHREVGAVVHDQLRLRARKYLTQQSCRAQDLLRRTGLVAILHQGDAGGAQAGREVFQRKVASGKHLRICNCIQPRQFPVTHRFIRADR